MESERFLRLKELIGKENYKKLKSAKVLLFGLGGVGGFVAECLARTGVGTIGLVDGDKVEESNFNLTFFFYLHFISYSQQSITEQKRNCQCDNNN